MLGNKALDQIGFEQGKCHSNHEKADTFLSLYAFHAARTMDKIVIWSTDTDVVVLMVHVWTCIKLELWIIMIDNPGTDITLHLDHS